MAVSPRVSILIPSYNHASYLEACLQSVTEQTFTDWELILVDDRSSDSSLEIARAFSEKDTRVQIHLNEANLGTYGTEQRALSLAQGEFAAVMNSDDLWGPEKLRLQVSQLNADSKAAFSYVTGAMIDAIGNKLSDTEATDLSKVDHEEPLPSLLAENRILASGVLFRRAQLRFETSCRYSGDWVALLEQSLVGRASYVSSPQTFWRQHDTNSYRRSIPQTIEEIRVRQAILKAGQIWCVRSIPIEAIRSGLGQNAMHLVPLLVFANQMAQARQAAGFAIRNHQNKKAALKRGLSLVAGRQRALGHFWAPTDLALADQNKEDLVAQFRAQQPLNFQRPISIT